MTIRLQRRGRKNDPSFRVVVVDSKEAMKTGSYLEMLGSLNRRTDHVELNAERIKHWIAHGAQTSDTVHNLLISQKIIEGKKINVLPRKSPPNPPAGEAGKDEPAVEAPAPAAAAAPEATPALVESEAGDNAVVGEGKEA